MKKSEVEQLTNDELLVKWKEISLAMKLLRGSLTLVQGNILFADFVNVSSEISKRNLNVLNEGSVNDGKSLQDE